jgi:hypothetical protein
VLVHWITPEIGELFGASRAGATSRL